MAIDMVSVNSLIKSDLPETRAKTEGNHASQNEFGKIFSTTLDTVKNEKVRIEKDKATGMAELIQLETLRSSLTLGEMTSEPAQGRVEKTINLLLHGMAECGKDDPGSGEVQGNRDRIDSQYQEQGLTGLDVIVSKASRRYGIDTGLIKAVIKAESNFNPHAVSRAGAEGLMQLMPATARGFGVTNSFDPEQNVMAGTRFLKEMLDRYDGNLNAALAAYNWGPGNVDRKGGALPMETREYLMKVKGYYAEYSA